MKSLFEYRESKKNIRPRFSSGEMVRLLFVTGEQYLSIVRKKKNGDEFFYSGDVIEANKNGRLAVVRRTYNVAEDQLERIPGMRHKK